MKILYILSAICLLYWYLIFLFGSKDNYTEHTYTYSMWKIISGGLSILLTIVFLYFGTVLFQEKYTAIKCLKGNNPYKMEIKYFKINDSTYIPVDTNYIKK